MHLRCGDEPLWLIAPFFPALREKVPLASKGRMRGGDAKRNPLLIRSGLAESSRKREKLMRTGASAQAQEILSRLFAPSVLL